MTAGAEPRTVVIQSWHGVAPVGWIETCLASVRAWTAQRGFDYRFVDDAIFARVPAWYREKTRGCPQMATDLGRLRLIEEALADGYDRALWLDADVLVFDPAGFDTLPWASCAFGRERWVQADGAAGRWRTYRNVHNAVCLFARGDPFLPFYAATCERIVARLKDGPDGGMVPQMVGPKLLTALHNIVGFDLLDEVAMASPPVVRDLAQGGGPALETLRRALPAPARAVNLCASLAGDDGRDGPSHATLGRACAALVGTPALLSPAPRPDDTGDAA